MKIAVILLLSLEINPAVDVSITAGVGSLWIASEVGKRWLVSDECRWCEPPALDLAVRRGLKWENTKRAARISDLSGYVGLPVALMALDGALAGDVNDWGTDVLLITEAVVISAAATQITKFAVARQRPFVYGGHGHGDSDENLSFFSGHTSLGFSLATSAGMIASLRGYRQEWVVWAVGLTGATALGYLRIAADKHYFTDVIVGAAIGAAAGISVPLLHSTERRQSGSTPIILMWSRSF